jgi:hypothetical protein
MPLVIPFIIAVAAWRTFGKKYLGPTLVAAQKINESTKDDFLDIEGDITSSEDVTQKYTEPKKGAVQIGGFQIGIIPLLIVATLLIIKNKK